MPRLRPQILVALLILGAITLYAINQGFNEISGMAVGGMVAISMKLLEAE